MSTADTWTVVNTRCDRAGLAQFNSVGTISNGYLGLTGNVAEERDGRVPVTLIHGVYDELDMLSLVRATNQPRPYLDPRYFDAAGKSPAVANLPDPLFTQVFVGERELSLGRGEIRDFEQSLDLRTGVYRYRFEFHDGWKRTTRVEMQRFASLTHPHRVYMRYALTPVDHEQPIRVHAGISGEIQSNIVPERQFYVTQLWTDPAERCKLLALTRARKIEVRVGVVHTVTNGTPTTDPVGIAEHDRVYTRYDFASTPGKTITLDRCVVLTSSEDLRHRIAGELEGELDAAAAVSFEAALAQQQAAWDKLWAASDVQIDGDERAQRYLRFCLHHLLAAAPRFSDRLSVPVKLLSGEYYQGNTFYDTDLLIVPFYTFTQPAWARTCLNYRYEGLRPAREIAHNLGRRGVKFPWQAGPHGEECLGRWWRFTHTNIHINADVAYALRQYVRASGDEAFLRERGVDLLTETARFYASRVDHDPEHGRYHLRDVAGPDEGHCPCVDNFYTNYLARHNLRWAAETIGRMAASDRDAYGAAMRRLALGRNEPQKWQQVAEGLTLPANADTQVYEQFSGYFQLPQKPADLLDHRKAWVVTVTPFQASNQPDVLMALALFRDEFDASVQRANWAFYKDKSLDLSSTSYAINSLVAAQVGDLDTAYRAFLISAGMDLDEALTERHDTHMGLHGTAMGGAWLAAVFGFGGVHLTERGLKIDPKLPATWTGLRFKLSLRGVLLDVAIDAEQVTVQAEAGRRLSVPVTVCGQAVALESGTAQAVPRRVGAH